MLVGLLTPELGRCAFSSSGRLDQPDNGLRCIALEHSVLLAAGLFRIRTGFLFAGPCGLQRPATNT